MQRGGARAPLQPRAPFLTLGAHGGAAAGSAYLELGATKVFVTAFGPLPNARAEGGDAVAGGALECRVQFAPFAARARRALAPGAAAEAERRLEAALAAALAPAVLLERFPRCVVELHVLFLQADGGELAAGTAAASAALVDAGVELVDVVAAAQVAFAPGGALLVDPDAEEEARCEARATVAYMPALRRATLVRHSGAVDESALARGLALALDAAAALGAALRPTLLAAARDKEARLGAS